MPLIFPSNPVLNQTYQSGSSATYIWNGSYWDIEIAPTATVITATSASVAFSATSASFASTGSSVNPLSQVVSISGSLVVTGSITGSMFGTASFASTASSVNILNQSVVISGSFTVFTGSAVEFQVHDVGVKIGSLQTDVHQITGSLNVTGSITGSLFGTASFASTASSVNTLNQSVVISGSFTVFTGSVVEFLINESGSRLGSTQNDRHTVTGSMFVSSSLTISGSLNLSGSLILNLSGSITGSTINQPTLIQAYNVSGQSIPNNSTATITGWTNLIAQNAGEWNPTTGVFTARKAATYLVTAQVLYSPATTAFVGDELNVSINGPAGTTSVAYNFSQTTANLFRYAGPVTAIVSLTPGQTMSIATYQNMGGARTLFSSQTYANTLTIQQIATRIIH